MKTMLGQGVYSVTEAARLTGLKQRHVREWFRRTQGAPCNRQEAVKRGCIFGFLDLIDCYVAGQLRTHGVALQILHRVYQRLKDDLQTSHPFCRRDMLNSGEALLTQVLDEDDEKTSMDLLTREQVFSRILLPFFKRIDYGEASNLAERWRLTCEVVLDPTICFGQPVVEAVGIPTAILAAAHHANGQDADLVADWYNVHPDHVLAAVHFETNRAG